jgi:hypothetical protein
VRLNQEDILEAVALLLRKRDTILADKYGMLNFKFGMVGDPLITLVGDAVDNPAAGQVYIDVEFQEMTRGGNA